jgi:addiction module RelE/StbE family toxin
MVIIFHKTFHKDYEKLPKKIQEKFSNKLKLFKEDKNHETLNNHSVDKVFPDCRSINITGDFRAIFKEEGDTVHFINIGTHSELY